MPRWLRRLRSHALRNLDAFDALAREQELLALTIRRIETPDPVRATLHDGHDPVAAAAMYAGDEYLLLRWREGIAREQPAAGHTLPVGMPLAIVSYGGDWREGSWLYLSTAAAVSDDPVRVATLRYCVAGAHDWFGRFWDAVRPHSSDGRLRFAIQVAALDRGQGPVGRIIVRQFPLPSVVSGLTDVEHEE